MVAIDGTPKLVVLILAGIFAICPLAAARNNSQLEPDVVAYVCAQEATPSFGPDGHLYSTFLIARYAGIDGANAYTLAYYSQYPDLDSTFKATSLFIGYPNWRSDVREVLHSLHGSEREAIDARREALKNFIKDSLSQDPPNYWQAGLMIHAFADAYSHTKKPLGDPDQKAYGSVIGHLHHWKKPDQIARQEVFPKYREFAEQLYDILELKGAGDKEQLTEFLNTIEELACENGCSGSDVERVEAAIMAASYTTGSFSESWYECIEERARPLRKEEVQGVLDRVKE